MYEDRQSFAIIADFTGLYGQERTSSDIRWADTPSAIYD